MVYQGSKNRLAKDLLPILTENLTEDIWYVEPFCGGCNLIDKMNHPLKSANDINQYLIALLRHVQSGGELPIYLSKEEYYKIKENKSQYEKWMVGFAGFVCSTRGKFFDCYNGIRNVKGGITRNYIEECRKNLLNQNLYNINFSCVTYFDMYIPDNSVVYCDPPYKDTKTYYKKNSWERFDYDLFWSWCRKLVNDKHCKVYVSSYNAPNDFTEIWCKELKSTVNSGEVIKSTERLYSYIKSVE